MLKFDYSKIEEKLCKHIDEKRYQHTKGVEMTAACMAMKFGYEAGFRAQAQHDFIERARIAGLLHDNAKCMSDEDLLKKCQKHEIIISETEEKQPYLLHGKLGAYYLTKRYEIQDEDIANAIAYHTTGRPNMSMLEKIIFIADYIEPGRNKQVNLELVRYLAMTDLDTCVYKIAEDTLSYLTAGECAIDEMTLQTRNYYKDYANMNLLATNEA